MATVERQHARTAPKPSLFDERGFPWLENGERMDQKTFHERYEKTPPGFKAELIGGIVYIMASPVSYEHGRSDFSVIGCLFVYQANTPGTVAQCNTTAILDDDSEPQPDSALLILPEYGGQTSIGGPRDQYTVGAPELVVEVAFSSRSIDLRGKLGDYERAGVREYLVLDLNDRAVRWFLRREGRLDPLEADADGTFRSRTFPGLWLDPVALVSGDTATLLATVNRGAASPEHAAFVAGLQRRRIAPNP